MELRILEQTTKKSILATWTRYKIELPVEPSSPLQCWGLDPGSANVGVAIIPYADGHLVDYAMLYQVAMPRWKDAVDRIVNWQNVLGELALVVNGVCRLVIEGAAYNQPYRQAELEDIRASTVLWAHRLAMHTKIVPPSTIRKCVLGSGKVKAEDVWYLPNAPDAVAALACAYYASDCWEK